MTPVHQRIYAAAARGDGHNGLGIAGDCLRAALASLLDLEYHDVPHVAHYGDTRHANDPEVDDPLTAEHGGLWWRRLRRWLRARDLDAACYPWKKGHQLRVYNGRGHPWEGDCLVSGRSPRGDFDHIVVGHYHWIPTGRPGRLAPGVVITHDPHPSGANLRTIEHLTLIVPPYDPPPPPIELDPADR